MHITYKSKKIERVCTVASVAVKSYGTDMSEKIHMRIDQISAADTVEQMIQFGIGKCHGLKGDRAGQYAMHLVEPYRLIFEKKESEIQIANIVEIVDYH